MSGSTKDDYSGEPDQNAAVAATHDLEHTAPKSHEKSGAPTTEDGLAGPEAEDIIEAADEGSDPGYETDTASAVSTSLASSVRDYAVENGRRYHKFQEGAYQFPKDEHEQARQDMKHVMVVNVCNGRLHYALSQHRPIFWTLAAFGAWTWEMNTPMQKL